MDVSSTVYTVIVQRVSGEICEANFKHPEQNPIRELETAEKLADDIAKSTSVVNVVVLELKQRVVREYEGAGAPKDGGRGMMGAPS